MKRSIVLAFLLVIVTTAAYAIKVTLFVSTKVFAERAKDIVVAECLSFPKLPKGVSYGDGLYPVEVRIIMTLKGDKKRGKERIATIYPMERGKRYLLASLGGSVDDIDFLAVPELSVVLLSADFDLETLEDKDLTEQLNAIFQCRYDRVKKEIHRLEEERKLLEKAVKKDKKSSMFLKSRPNDESAEARLVSSWTPELIVKKAELLVVGEVHEVMELRTEKLGSGLDLGEIAHRGVDCSLHPVRYRYRVNGARRISQGRL